MKTACCLLVAAGMVTAACGSGSSVPVLEQRNVHFAGCPTAPQSSDTTCSAVATVHNTGAAGTSRQVFYFSLRSGGSQRQATCTPSVPNIPAGGSVDLSCEVTVPAGTVPADLVLSGR